jgi:23S rRNA (adenine2030-N6)-methyltransferase
MHYRHRFHAGNFADVFKHVLFCGLLDAFARKDKPWFALDTHAGAGLYDLLGQDADRTGEWREGIGRLWSDTGPHPELVSLYLDQVRALQGQDGALRLYPGSPLLAGRSLGAQGRLALCEKIEAVAEELRYAMTGIGQTAIHVRNGYETLGLLPPAEKRGLVLIDPPFEAVDEFDRVLAYLQTAFARFAHGVYAIWLPLKNGHASARFLRRARSLSPRPSVSCSLETGAPGEGQMRACGMLIFNPPFGFEAQARAALPWLSERLAQGAKPVWSLDSA